MNSLHNELVVLLHGIGRTSHSMRRIEKTLRKQQYQTLNIDYPSRQKSIVSSADNIYQQILTYPQLEHLTIHFVTHSMGGLVARHLLHKLPLEKVQRIIMLGPPNQGSEVADFVYAYKLFRAFYGPALEEMTTTYAKSHPYPALPSHCEVGIIAGSFNIDPICYFILPSGNDGKVTFESTKLERMTDHLILRTSHSFMMYNPNVIQQISHFLAHGRFLPPF
ncbi:alpha/beta fold hydrolase [Candidatus Berkiella aquae]|uniref:Alpha/beta fold hydrolase n=1 Tax=Candidatus Berkiella aquae TaxID=295108 RepID=A0A0Q9YWP2_9GAMM|nr:alpha/beta fold hydrolase [Candidatus Berkiella aquae]MCS5712651.1 alpha/beta fold hydrolase [Candidatus Berkiella aquae]